MARPLRVLIPGGWYHVFGRGWERRPIFSDDRDREHFIELLERLSETYRFIIHGYALMENHCHLIIQTPDANLSRGMQWFNTSYSAWFNARHARVGSLWQGRYRDVVIEDGAWALELSVYVHLNPIRIAGLGLDKNGRVLEGQGFRVATAEQVSERLQRLRSYRWSSYRAYAGYVEAPSWLTTGELLKRAHGDPRNQRSAYRETVKTRLTYGVDATACERLRDVIAIGSAEFARRIRETAGDELAGLDQKRALRRRITVEEARRAVAEVRGEEVGRIAGKRSDPGRSLFLWAVRKRCGLTLREAGEAVGGLKPAAVDAALRRLVTRTRSDPFLRAQQERLLHVLQSAK
jgi:REP element-mobilizing transposase RayT